MAIYQENQQKFITRWLKLAVFMLAASGVFSLIIVFARTPGLYDIPYVQKLFHEALVIHVDLLVVAWPLCIAGMMWMIFCPSKMGIGEIRLINVLGMLFIGFGALKLVLAPLDISAEPLKNNYVPIITSDVFLMGLSLMASGAALLAFHAVFLNKRDPMSDVSLKAILNWGARGVGIIVLFGLVAIYLGFKHTSPADIDPEHYYESAIWAGGHIFQYAFTQLQMLAWLWIFLSIYSSPSRGEVRRGASLDEQCPPGPLPSPPPNGEGISFKWVRAIFLLNVLIGSAGIYGILTYDTLSFAYNQFYTRHMIIGGGIAPVLLLLWMTCAHLRRPRQVSATRERDLGSRESITKPLEIPAFAGMTGYLRPALFVSIGLFLYGGLLGLLIQGQDVTIPAHYHGATISVTIALMGFVYAYLPNLTKNTLPAKLIKLQPIIYGVGQFMHISGLAISGGYGALRKTPGVEGTAGAKAAMGIMGMGGLLAVIGGLMFVYIMWRCLKRHS